MAGLFTENLGAKFLALLLAAGVWFYVASGEARLINFPSPIPLQTRNVATGLVAKTTVQQVNIQVVTAGTTLKNLSADSFSAYVDLTGLSKGTHLDVPVHVTSSTANVDIKNIDPATVNVTLDAAVTKTVPVVVKIEGKPGDGLAPDDPTIDPATVEVSGAKSDVDTIVEATAVVKLNGETANVTKSVALQGFNAKGDQVDNLTFNPAQANVTIPIIKAGKTKEVGIKVHLSGSPASGYWIANVTSDPSSVTITGNADALTSAVFIETNNVNVEGLNGTKSYKTTLNVPNGITLVDNVDQITVTVSTSSIDTTREVTAGLNLIGLSPSLALTDNTSSPIKVIVSGQAAALNSLNSNNVVVNLDLSSYKTAGTYTLNITRDMISTPAGTAAAQFNPSAITLKIDNK